MAAKRSSRSSPPRNPRSRRRHVDTLRALCTMPGAYSTGAFLCGLFALLVVARGGAARDGSLAAAAILFAAMLDVFDTRLGKLTRTESVLARELDSLGSLVAFGVAPLALLHARVLGSVELVGLAASFAYGLAVLLRIARYKTVRALTGRSGRDTLGLPLPMAAVAVVTLALAVPGTSLFAARSACAAVIALSGLVAAGVNLESFKTFGVRRKPLTLATTALVLLAWAIWRFPVEVALAAVTWSFVACGLLEEVLFFRLRLAEPAPPPVELAGAPVYFEPQREHDLPAAALALLDVIPMSLLERVPEQPVELDDSQIESMRDDLPVVSDAAISLVDTLETDVTAEHGLDA